MIVTSGSERSPSPQSCTKGDRTFPHYRQLLQNFFPQNDHQLSWIAVRYQRTPLIHLCKQWAIQRFDDTGYLFTGTDYHNRDKFFPLFLIVVSWKNKPLSWNYCGDFWGTQKP